MGKSWDNPQNYPISQMGLTDGGNRRPLPTIGRSSRNGTCRKCGKRERGYKDVEPCRCVEPDFNEKERRKKDRDFFIDFLTSIFAECLRIARPGAIALVWAIPRTSHWTATAIEDAGWEIEDRISHLFGTGFPKHKSKLKPACEDWWLCRKPGPKWLGVEECRIATGGESLAGGRVAGSVGQSAHEGWRRPWMQDDAMKEAHVERAKERLEHANASGRWPSHVIIGDDETAAMLDDAASRFFYCPKADKADRGKGNKHPTVKSSSLMSWLVRLACPEGGTVLDPFMGSGSTSVACVCSGRHFIGIEKEPDYFAIAEKRLSEAAPLFVSPAPEPQPEPTLFDALVEA